MSLGGDSGGTNESRRIEADRLLERITAHDDDLNKHDLAFVMDCQDPDRVITSRMIFWLRDIAERVDG